MVDQSLTREFKPGDINNYAYGYQDVTGYSAKTPKLDEPAFPDDEGYMQGWFSGLAMLADNNPNHEKSFQYRNPKKYGEILDQWNKWRKDHGLGEVDRLPL